MAELNPKNVKNFPQVSTEVFFLHGFLGRPEDWNSVIEICRSQCSDVKFTSLDYFNTLNLSPEVSLEDWGQKFLDFVGKKPQDLQRILVGYSLGGRLAQQVLWADQGGGIEGMSFDHVILVSSHPGLKAHDFKGREQRKKNDESWAQRFLKEEWHSLLREWNSQEVFSGGDQEPQRFEKDFSREKLSQALKNWSLALQKPSFELFEKFPDSISVLIGSRDRKYQGLYQEIQLQRPSIDLQIVPESGHRILFDSPHSISRALLETISTVTL